MKTARFIFGILGRRDCRYAILDVHILRWLKEQGVKKVPNSTPGRKDYLRLEQEYLKLCDKLGRDFLDLDDEVWGRGAGWI